ncbi:proteasome assembly chaperone 2 [Strongylocentrotus purpuratus]|uniref:Proteasome assembly chaperone 2 n=1 Tax=Strongylocentrotus purpuratus TaxID=7668 RepID=A0A7M7G0Q6_STRPU|nr:proteasome assembly chaperone 2 [Strongylocentrotus purpuratus]
MYFNSVGVPECPNWTGFSLIMPAVSVGNIGQLTCDLLINTLKLTKMGCFSDQSLQPLCGNDAFHSTGIAAGKLVTSAEVFESQEKKIVVIQQRAALVQGRAGEFRRKLIEWIKEKGFSRVILITSCFAYEKTDAIIQSNTCRYLMTPSLEAKKDEFVSNLLKYPQLEKKPAEEGLELPRQPDDIPEAARDIRLSGGGIAKKLFIDCCKEDVPMAVLLLFCAEGDNTPHAMMMASFTNALLHLIPEPTKLPAGTPPWKAMWRPPASWTMLFGGPVDPTIY